MTSNNYRSTKTSTADRFIAESVESYEEEVMTEMEQELKQKIEKTVRDILQEANLDETTERQVRETASAKLCFDLSKHEYKGFVRQVVACFIEEQNARKEEENAKKQAGEEQEEEEERGVAAANDKKDDDDDDILICRLSSKRKVTVRTFRGRKFVSIREFYEKDGKELPSRNGISLTKEQWGCFRDNVPAIQEAIDKMKSRMMRGKLF